MRAGAMEDRSPEELEGCSSCLRQGTKAGRKLEEIYLDLSLLHISVYCHCHLIGQIQQLASQGVWVMQSARVNFAEHRTEQKREKNRIGVTNE